MDREERAVWQAACIMFGPTVAVCLYPWTIFWFLSGRGLFCTAVTIIHTTVIAYLVSTWVRHAYYIVRNRKAYLACRKFYHGILDIPDLEVRVAGLDAENYENYLVTTTVLACVVKQIQDQLKEKYIPNENPFLVLDDLFQQIELDQ